MEKIDFCKAEKVKGEENQMEEKKTNQQSRVAESEIIIDSVQPYRENYQMRMLKNNRIPGLLRVSGCGMEGASRYYYHTGHAQSLETSYKNRDIRAKEILKLIEKVNLKYGNTIIMVTHNDAIKDMADRVVKLKDGGIRSNILNKNKIPAAELEW